HRSARRRRSSGNTAAKRRNERRRKDERQHSPPSSSRWPRGPSSSRPGSRSEDSCRTSDCPLEVHTTTPPLTYDLYEPLQRTHPATRDLGAVPLRALSGGHFTALYAELEQNGLSVSSRRLVHTVLSGAMGAAMRWGKLTRNPARAADPPVR